MEVDVTSAVRHHIAATFGLASYMSNTFLRRWDIDGNDDFLDEIFCS